MPPTPFTVVSATDAITALFVPADRPERIEKALESGADLVIVDLEDAVAAEAKTRARQTLADWLTTHPRARVFVRINATDSEQANSDLALVAEHAAAAGLMLPKAAHTEQLDWAGTCKKPVLALIETPAGVLNAARLAAHPACARLAFGALDMAVAAGIDDASAAGQLVLDHARAQLVLAAAGAGKPAPLDSPQPTFRNPEPVQKAAAKAAAMGFGGMLAIHPAQLNAITCAFMPSAQQLDWARRVAAAVAQAPTSGAVALDGAMIDRPLILRAEELLARAKQLRRAQQ